MPLSKRIEIITLVVIDVWKQLDEEVRAAAGDVNQRTFFAYPHTGGDSQSLGVVSKGDRVASGIKNIRDQMTW